MSKPMSGHFEARPLWRLALQRANATGTHFPAAPRARPARPRVDGWGALAAALVLGLVLGSAAATGWWTDNVDRIVAREVRAAVAVRR